MTTSKHGVIIDNGTGFIKAGFINEDKPRSIFRNVIGTSKYERMHRYGENAFAASMHKINLYYPMEHGIITNWDPMESI